MNYLMVMMDSRRKDSAENGIAGGVAARLCRSKSVLSFLTKKQLYGLDYNKCLRESVLVVFVFYVCWFILVLVLNISPGVILYSA